jgi:hypothetical protein
MSLSIGIVGLPNVGKSMLFNALTKNNVPAENYPFNTIEPNVGIVPVADERLQKIAEVEKPEKVVPAVVKFVDIAGLVKGAHKGEGLGNQFLANIREVDAIVQVVRAFESTEVHHTEGSVDPLRDIETIETELILKDLDSVESKWAKVERDRGLEDEVKEYVRGLLDWLGDGKRAFEYNEQNSSLKVQGSELVAIRKELSLLTDKPLIYLFNQSMDKHKETEDEFKSKFADEVVILDVKMESELSELNDEEKKEYLKEFGLEKSGFETLTMIAYRTLGLISFFTSGPKEVRAWTIIQGTKAPQAAGVIHTDFEKKFIACDVVTYEDFVNNDGWVKCKEFGKVRLEGKDYVFNDGDITLFKHG